MTTRYVPDQYPDLVTALLSASNGDTIVLNFSTAMSLHGYATSLATITIAAGTGYAPVLDVSLATDPCLDIAANGWTFSGIRFRSTRAGFGRGLRVNGVNLLVTGCTFEGCTSAVDGNWSGTVQQSAFRHVSTRVSNSTGSSVFAACTFVQCTGNRVLDLGAGSVIDNCTFSRCSTTNTMARARSVRNNTAQGCEASGGGAAIFDGPTACLSNNAFDCTADVIFDGNTSDNTTIDPQHINLYSNLRLLPTSPLIGAGSSSVAETAYLPFNGTTQYGFAAALFGGVTDTYTIAIKVQAIMPAGAAAVATYFASGGAGASASTQSRYDQAGRLGTTGSAGYWLGFGDSGVRYSASGVPASLTAGQKIIAIKRTATQAKLRVISTSGVEYSNDVASTVLVPNHLGIAACCAIDGTPFAFVGPAQVISDLISDEEVTDAAMLAWLLANDARTSVPGILSYHVMGAAVGSSVPDFGPNNVPLTLTNITASSLVTIAPPLPSGLPAYDFDGDPFLSPITVGAFENTRLASVDVPDVYTIVATITDISNLGTQPTRESWTLTTTDGLRVAVIAQSQDDDEFTLTTWPNMSPDCEYTLTLQYAEYGTSVVTFTPDAALELPDPTDDYRNIAAVMNATGWQFFAESGIAESFLAAELGPDDTIAFVHSTLNWSPAGAFWVQGLLLAYTSKTDGALHGLTSALPRTAAIPQGVRVVANEPDTLPSP